MNSSSKIILIFNYSYVIDPENKMRISTSIIGKYLLNTYFERDTDSRQQREQHLV